MADILSFRDDPHQSTEMLLPWYATGQLEPEDVTSVETHLRACDQCRAALEREQQLKQEVGRLPLHPDLGWEKLQRRLAPDRRTRRRDARTSRRPWIGISWPAALAALAGAQMVTLAFAVLLIQPSPPAGYRTLNAPAARVAGNILVLFRPDTSEAELRSTIVHAGARLVGGPTAAGAYVLDVDPGRREAATAELRAQPIVMMAQPIDAGSAR